MKPVKLIYSTFRELDIFLSHSNKPWGRIIRLAETLTFNPKDDTTPTHGGFITNSYKQYFATEMELPGIQENSLEKYTGKREQIVELWRCKAFWDKPETRVAAREYLAYLRREQLEYNMRGAILSSPLGNKLFGWMPFFNKNQKGQFCTDNTADVLRKFVDSSSPIKPDPLELSLYFKSNKSLYVPIPGYQEIK